MFEPGSTRTTADESRAACFNQDRFQRRNNKTIKSSLETEDNIDPDWSEFFGQIFKMARRRENGKQSLGGSEAAEHRVKQDTLIDTSSHDEESSW